jgi:para-aminobenzoate synthetase component 1
MGDIAPAAVASQLRDLPGLILFESARAGRNARWSYLTADPVDVVDAPTDGADPFAGARRLLARLAAGPAGAVPFAGGLAGYLGYDLGRRLERLPVIAAADQDLPEIHLALHDWVVAWDHRAGAAFLAGRAIDGDADRLRDRLAGVRDRLAGFSVGGGSAGRVAAAGRVEAGLLGSVSRHEAAFGSDRGGLPLRFLSGLDRAAFEAGVESLRTSIADGQLYQANLARRLVTAFDGDPWPLYRRLRSGDPARFAAFISLGRAPAGGGMRALLSASPEPFLAVTGGGDVSTDPIKGTRSRGLDADEERDLARDLLNSAKDRAENVMIVDVLRNDLGRVCRPGTVRVPRLCRLERAGAVQHLVSTVTGRLLPDLGPFDLLAAAFPGGSVTGAPKIRAMQLIEGLEPVRRGPYTGAAGWIGPDGAMQTSIVIRTFVADGRRLTLHVGGGITWRSEPAQEWEETRAKARGPLQAIGAVEVVG